jgi:hypothetical protein
MPGSPASALRRLRGGTGGRALLVADQGLSSLTNFLAPWLVLLTGTETEFVVFALYYSIYIFALSLTRQVTGMASVIVLGREGSDAETPRIQSIRASSLLAAPWLLLAVGMVVLRPHGGPSTLVALLLVGTAATIVQDVTRHHLIAARRHLDLCVVDGVWLVVTAPAVLWALLGDPPSGVALAGWTLGAGASAAVGVGLDVGRRALGALVPGLDWLRVEGPLAMSFAGEALLDGGASVAATWLSAAVIGAAANGQIEAARLAMSPVTVLVAGTSIGLMAKAARRADGVVGLRRSTRSLALALVGCAVAWGALLALLTPSLGALFGEAWPGGRSAIGLAAVVGTASMAALRPARAFIRGLDDRSTALAIRVKTAPFFLLGQPVGALVTRSATGAAIGLAAAFVAATLLWWRSVAVVRPSAMPERSRSASPDDQPSPA